MTATNLIPADHLTVTDANWERSGRGRVQRWLHAGHMKPEEFTFGRLQNSARMKWHQRRRNRRIRQLSQRDIREQLRDLDA